MIVLLVATAGAGPLPDGVTVSLAPSRPSFVVGEAEWLVLTIDNRGTTPFRAEATGSSRNERDNGLVEVTAADGTRAPDAFHRPGPSAGGLEGGVTVAAGAQGELRIDLARHAWLDTPGTYDVRVFHPLGAPWEPLPDDPRWTHTRVVIVAPDPAALAAVVAAHPRATDDQDPGLRNTYDALGHAIYVPLLEALAAKDVLSAELGPGMRRGSRLDDRALSGLGACPCVAATEALLRLASHRDAEVRRIVHDELLLRITDRSPTPRSWFLAQAWDERLVPSVLPLARSALAPRPGDDGWGDDVAFGAELVRRQGAPSDAQQVVAALARLLAADGVQPQVVNGRHGLLLHLLFALATFPDVTSTDPETALALSLRRWDGHIGTPPSDWETPILAALASDDPNLVSLALSRMPPSPSPAVGAAVAPFVGSTDTWIHLGVQRFLRAHPDPSLAGPALEAVSTNEGPLIGPAVDVARSLGAPMDQIMERLIARLAPGPSSHWVVGNLSSVLSGCQARGTGPVDDGELPTLKAAWTTFLDTNRAVLQKRGSVPIDPATTDPALIPRSFSCTLASGETWPR